MKTSMLAMSLEWWGRNLGEAFFALQPRLEAKSG